MLEFPQSYPYTAPNCKYIIFFQHTMHYCLLASFCLRNYERLGRWESAQKIVFRTKRNLIELIKFGLDWVGWKFNFLVGFLVKFEDCWSRLSSYVKSRHLHKSYFP